MTSSSYLLKNRNKRLRENGLELLANVPRETIAACFFDPQYRSIMERMKFGNEGARQKERARLPQMSEELIAEFLAVIAFCLKPGGYCFFWVDKFMLAEGVHRKIVTKANELNAMRLMSIPFYQVDVLTWDKVRMGMGSRTRRRSEFLVILQKFPKSTKSWKDKGIPDVWCEAIVNPRSNHTHKKPIRLLSALIRSVTKPGEWILDPCAGSFAVLDACQMVGDRHFIGCDISPKYGLECPHGRKSPEKCRKCAETQAGLQ